MGRRIKVILWLVVALSAAVLMNSRPPGSEDSASVILDSAPEGGADPSPSRTREPASDEGGAEAESIEAPVELEKGAARGTTDGSSRTSRSSLAMLSEATFCLILYKTQRKCLWL